MRKSGGAIGAIQVGPGIITIHDAKGYSWSRFREEIVRVFEAFTDFYPQSAFALNIVKTELRFVNGVTTEGSENLLQFLEEKLHTKVELDPTLFAPNQVQAKPDGLGINVAFSINDPVGKAMLAIGSGEMDEKAALIQQMFFHSLGESAPQDLGSLDPWLDAMHNIAKNWFDTLYRGDLMKRFV